MTKKKSDFLSRYQIPAKFEDLNSLIDFLEAESDVPEDLEAVVLIIEDPRPGEGFFYLDDPSSMVRTFEKQHFCGTIREFFKKFCNLNI